MGTRTRRLGALALLALALGAAGVVGTALYLQGKGITPRALAPYVERRSSGHNPTIEGLGSAMARTLDTLDRGEQRELGMAPAGIGAQAVAVLAPVAGRPVLVGSPDEVRRAFAAAMPGDVITFLPGTYRFAPRAPQALRPGTASAGISVRADLPGSVIIEMNTTEGFLVDAPYWTFANLTVRGVCAQHPQCEHAFHVVGKAHHFAALNNTISDFNAHFKINGVYPDFPDAGRIEGNTLSNSSPRLTANPVTLIDLVAASGWTIQRNRISDFIKAGGDRISYGAFVKGGGSVNLLAQNAVLCEAQLKGRAGQRVGLSLGGGGTGKEYCRDKRCITEQDRSEVRNNLVAACSDAGIYLNSASSSVVLHNTLVDTAGIQVRHPESSAVVEGNLVDGGIVGLNDALIRRVDNLDTPIAYAYAGYHPLRALFGAAGAFDFSWAGQPPRRSSPGAPVLDLCGAPRPPAAAYGAIEDYQVCLQPFKGAGR